MHSGSSIIIGEQYFDSDNLSLGDKVSLEAHQIFDGTMNGFGNAVADAVTKHPLKTVEQFVGTAAASCLLTGMLYRFPNAAETLKIGLTAGMAVDVTSRLNQVVRAGIDTWSHPEHYAKNEQIVEKSFGYGAFDYAVMGLGAAAGLKLGESHFGSYSDLSESLQRAFEARPEAIPKLETTKLFQRAIPDFQPADDSLAAQLFTAKRDAVVFVSKGDGSTGTGYVVNGKEGLVMTNWHVARGASDITMTTTDGVDHPVRIIGRDSFADLALLKMCAKPITPLPELELAESSSTMKPGDPVFAIGHPAGLETEVLSVGHYTGHELLEPLNVQGKAFNRPIAGVTYDLPIIDGSSGSPVFNTQGKVVSMATMSDANRFSSGASVEHIHSLLAQVEQANTARGWITVNSRAAVNEGALSMPVSVTASAVHGTRIGLAERFNWTPPEEPEGSELLGSGRSAIIAGAHQLLWDIAEGK